MNDDRTLLERILDERVALAGLAIELIMLAVGLGLVEMATVAGVLTALRQVVTPHRTDKGKRRRAARARRRAAR